MRTRVVCQNISLGESMPVTSLRIFSAGRHLGVAQQGAREGDQLLLAGAEGGAPLRQHQVQALPGALDHVRQVRAAQRRPALRVAVLPKGRQVEAQAAREQHRHLRNMPEQALRTLQSPETTSKFCAKVMSYSIMYSSQSVSNIYVRYGLLMTYMFDNRSLKHKASMLV